MRSKTSRRQNLARLAGALACALLLTAHAASAQTTSFTYQGQLTGQGGSANGTYVLQFKLFDAATGGAQVGPTLTFDGAGSNPPAVTVTKGAFTVQLDFGAGAFPGADRYLEVGVMRRGESEFTPLGPRQQITSTPYAIRAVSAANADAAANSQQLGGAAADQFVRTDDPRLFDTRLPASGGSNYAQNTTTQQADASFNISGDGTAGGTLSGNAVNAATQYNLGGQRVLGAAGSSLFAGPGAGSNTTGGSNSFFGADAGRDNTTGTSNSFFGGSAGTGNTSGANITLVGSGSNVGGDGLDHATAIGAGAVVSSNNTVVLGRGADAVQVPGSLAVATLGAAGSTALCRNASNQIADCSSSLRYKTNIEPFSQGLSLLRRLRPISFNWKEGGTRDVGFGAEDVAAVNPLLVVYNSEGQVEGVKYDRLSVAFVNAFKEQQAQIERQRDQIKEQQNQIDALRRLVCLDHPNADVCR